MNGDLFVNLLDGFGTVLQPQYLMYGALGVLIGTFVGVLPGVGPPLTIALLLPLTYTFEPTAWCSAASTSARSTAAPSRPS